MNLNEKKLKLSPQRTLTVVNSKKKKKKKGFPKIHIKGTLDSGFLALLKYNIKYQNNHLLI